MEQELKNDLRTINDNVKSGNQKIIKLEKEIDDLKRQLRTIIQKLDSK